ncbi:MAG: hypothetical protein ACMXYG_02680 [Candidatus Woesearchaeota archaeon]
MTKKPNNETTKQSDTAFSDDITVKDFSTHTYTKIRQDGMDPFAQPSTSYMKKALLGAALVAGLALTYLAVDKAMEREDRREDIRLEEHAQMARMSAPLPGSLDLSADVMGYYDNNSNLAYVAIGNDVYQVNTNTWARTPLGDGMINSQLKRQYNFPKLEELIIRINSNTRTLDGNRLNMLPGKKYAGIPDAPVSIDDIDLTDYTSKPLFTNW